MPIALEINPTVSRMLGLSVPSASNPIPAIDGAGLISVKGRSSGAGGSLCRSDNFFQSSSS
jgi:hypothetical protein